MYIVIIHTGTVVADPYDFTQIECPRRDGNSVIIIIIIVTKQLYILKYLIVYTWMRSDIIFYYTLKISRINNIIQYKICF